MAKIAPVYTAYEENYFLSQAPHIRNILARNTQNQIEVFFRADDIGVPSALFTKLITLFKKHNLPLCLAVVPSWLTERRLADLYQITGELPLWCWHQHGRRHINHELEGKKQEFGPARDAEVARDIKKGKERLQKLMGKKFQHFFTPPWNRCSDTAMEALQGQGFHGFSRFVRAQPAPPEGLAEFPVNLDLHTRREEAAGSLAQLYQELQIALQSGRCGVMLHHQCMNDNAFVFLDVLLTEFCKQPHITFTDFTTMAAGDKKQLK